MLETTKDLMENHLCNYTIGERDHYSPDELRELIQDIVKIEREDAFRRGKDYVYATAVELLSRESVNKLLGDM